MRCIEYGYGPRIEVLKLDEIKEPYWDVYMPSREQVDYIANQLKETRRVLPVIVAEFKGKNYPIGNLHSLRAHQKRNVRDVGCVRYVAGVKHDMLHDHIMAEMLPEYSIRVNNLEYHPYALADGINELTEGGTLIKTLPKAMRPLVGITLPPEARKCFDWYLSRLNERYSIPSLMWLPEYFDRIDKSRQTEVMARAVKHMFEADDMFLMDKHTIDMITTEDPQSCSICRPLETIKGKKSSLQPQVRTASKTTKPCSHERRRQDGPEVVCVECDEILGGGIRANENVYPHEVSKDPIPWAEEAEQYSNFAAVPKKMTMSKGQWKYALDLFQMLAKFHSKKCAAEVALWAIFESCRIYSFPHNVDRIMGIVKEIWKRETLLPFKQIREFCTAHVAEKPEKYWKYYIGIHVVKVQMDPSIKLRLYDQCYLHELPQISDDTTADDIDKMAQEIVRKEFERLSKQPPAKPSCP